MNYLLLEVSLWKFYITLFYMVFSSYLTCKSTNYDDMLCCNVFLFKSLPQLDGRTGRLLKLNNWVWLGDGMYKYR